ncbi:MAG: response regulator [Acidobacteria bacterium]|nr:response regulator [Acidobacteriota bacterium]MBV9474755.1 response regulator [Acidobacteriota bacterium]
MVLLSIRLLGEFAALDYRGNALSIGNRRTQSLVVYLALRISGRSSFAEIAALLFGDAGAQGEVREAVRDLRYALRYLPHDILLDDGVGVRFNRDVVEVDVQRFSELVASPSINTIRRAAEYYRGNLLEHFATGMRAFDEWIAEKRLNCWRAAIAIFGNLLTTQIRAGWWEEAVETAGRLLSLDPSQEVVHRTLMRLQLEQGRPDAALRRYQECADILRREYQREPSPETERLHREIVAALERTPAPREVGSIAADRPVLVLVVEDDLVSSALIDGFLSEAGYEVVTVPDGADALLELGRRRFDLLILDINIPTISGLQVFEIMLQKRIETPALFITGIQGTDVETQSLEMGAAGFLRKPIRKEVLLPKIRGILQRSHGKLRAANGG